MWKRKLAQERRFQAGGFQVQITIKWRTTDKCSGLAKSRGQMCGDKVMNGVDERGVEGVMKDHE